MGFSGFDYADRRRGLGRIHRLTAGRPCDMAGHDLRTAAQAAAPALAVPDADHPGPTGATPTGVFPTPDGRARFLPRSTTPPRETPDHEFPLVLTTGRLYAALAHADAHRPSRDKLVAREPAPFVEVHPDDAASLGLKPASWRELTSRRGIAAAARPPQSGAAAGHGLRAVPLGRRVRRTNAANYLTISAIGRVAKQPELKYLRGPAGTRHSAFPRYRARPVLLRAPGSSPQSSSRRQSRGINLVSFVPFRSR